MELGIGGRWLAQWARVPMFGAALFVALVELVQTIPGGERVYAADTLEARVRQVDQLRVHDRVPLDVEIRNTSDRPSDFAVWMTAESDSLGELQMIPEPSADGATRLVGLAPGEERLVSVELEPDAPGPQRAELRIRGSRGDELRIPIRVFAVP